MQISIYYSNLTLNLEQKDFDLLVKILENNIEANKNYLDFLECHSNDIANLTLHLQEIEDVKEQIDEINNIYQLIKQT